MLNTLSDALRDFGDLKVWSVLTTIFGDLVLQEGCDISGPVLSQISSEIGIRPEAHRVALHRLRKDGWIDGRKEGRVSRYFLSIHAREQTRLVHDWVYDLKPQCADRCYLIISPETDVPLDWIKIGPQSYLSPSKDQEDGAIHAKLDQEKIPDWALKRVISDDTHNELTRLATLLGQDHKAPSNPLDRLVLRSLILHQWRRLVLRYDAFAETLMPNAWAGAECRRLVHHWLDRLPKDDLNSI